MKNVLNAVMTVSLVLASAPAMAQSALEQLKLQAGDNGTQARVAPIFPIPGGAAVDAPAEIPLTARTKARLSAAFRKLAAQGFQGVTWEVHPLPLGVRYVSYRLTHAAGNDVIDYTALIYVGALAPNAPVLDPNQAKSFILVRSGGYAGIVAYSSSVSLDEGDATDKASYPRIAAPTPADLQPVIDHIGRLQRTMEVRGDDGQLVPLGALISAVEVLGDRVIVNAQMGAKAQVASALRSALDPQELAKVSVVEWAAMPR